MFGRISKKRILRRGHAERLGGACTKSRWATSSVAARVDAGDARRVADADHQHDQPEPGAEDRDEEQRQHDRREGEDDVEDAHDGLVDPAPRVAGDRAPGPTPRTRPMTVAASASTITVRPP